MELNLDFKLDRLIKEIVKEIKEELGVEITYNVAKKIIEQQYLTTLEGMRRGDTIVWKYFGTIGASKKRVDALNNMYIRKGLTPTLVDTGLVRRSFTKSGTEIGESVFESTSKKDYTVKDGHI